MFYREIFKLLSSYLFYYAIILLIPFAAAFYYEFFVLPEYHPQLHSTTAFGITVLVCLLLAAAALFFARGAKTAFYQREALATVVLIWFITPVIAALPFLLSGTLERFDQAYFEMVSGFTTTGATILEPKLYDEMSGEEIPIQRTYCGVKVVHYVFKGTVTPVKDPKTGIQLEGIEAVGKALLLWRSLTEWVGGMGIIVFFVALLPALGIGTKALFQAEIPGPIKEGLEPRIKETALNLWKIYLVLTVLQIGALLFTNSKIEVFDAVNLALTTVSTGGFSIHNENMAYYNNSYTEWVVMVFMILGSLNFAFYYHILKGKFYRLFEPEFILYLTLLLLFGIFASWKLWEQEKYTILGGFSGQFYSLSEAIRTGFFQAVSTQSSSGFFTADYDTWPTTVQIMMLISMYIGGMARSTAGGIKIIRFQMLYQIVKNKIESTFRPKVIHVLRMGRGEIASTEAFSVLCFFLVVVTVSIAGTFFYALDGIDPETALGLTSCMVNNTGIAFRAAGPTGTVAFLSSFSLYLSTFLMILGRLEFYALLVVLMPAFWKDK